MKHFHWIIALLSIWALCPAAASAQNPRVAIETNFGTIVIELYPDAAPVTVANFLSYVNGGFYDGILFHRSETIGRQTSDGMYIYTGTLDVLQAGLVYMINNGYYARQAGNPIINESYNGLSNVRGTIAMARSTDPDSASAQFFINHQDNTGLDKVNYPDGYGYCVFGAVVKGMDVVDAIAQTNLVVFKNLTNFFPYNPYVIITLAYELPSELSYCSDLTKTGWIRFDDFAVFASQWLDDCDSANSFCDGADLDYSGGVDIVDLDLFLSHWARTAGYETRFSDLAYNHTIDTVDLTVFMQRWLDSECDPNNNYCDQADINRDGQVDLIDYSLLGNNWQQSY